MIKITNRIRVWKSNISIWNSEGKHSWIVYIANLELAKVIVKANSRRLHADYGDIN